jgi:hypothetical protein
MPGPKRAVEPVKKKMVQHRFLPHYFNLKEDILFNLSQRYVSLKAYKAVITAVFQEREGEPIIKARPCILMKAENIGMILQGIISLQLVH